jgi:beta-lactamase regulating signal transducer with metallopeptidase domain
MLAIVSWLIPWHLLQISVADKTDLGVLLSMPTFDFMTEIPSVESLSAKIDPSAIHQISNMPNEGVSIHFLIDILVGIALSVGLLLLVMDILRYKIVTTKWRKSSSAIPQIWAQLKLVNPNIEVRHLPKTDAGMATGLLSPTIWLGDKLKNEAQQKAALVHELTHIKQGDIPILWSINAIQKLLWFNPIVWKFAKYAKQQIELSCDERCESQFPQGEYQKQLIQIILGSRQNKHPQSKVLAMNSDKSFNLQRVQKLNQDTSMKKSHFITASLLLALFSWISISNATTTYVQSSQAYKDIQRAFMYAWKNEAFTKAHDELLAFSKNMHHLKPSEQANIWYQVGISCFKIECEYSQTLSYIDLALTHQNALSIAQQAKYLRLAHQMAVASDKHLESIHYFEKVNKLPLEISEQTVYLQAVIQFKQENYKAVLPLLQRLIQKAESQGEVPKESWLKLLSHSYFTTNESVAGLAILAKLAKYYPSEKNKAQLASYSRVISKI